MGKPTEAMSGTSPAEPPITIGIGTDLTQYTLDQIRAWLAKNRESGMLGQAAEYRSWQDAASYLSFVNLLGGVKNVVRAVVGEKFLP